MKAERTPQAIIVRLSQEETFSVQAGRTIGDRPRAILPDSKIEVAPLSAVQEDDSLKDQWSLDRLEKGLKTPLKGNLFPNGDLQVLVPAIKFSDVRISHASLPRETIVTPMTEDKDRAEYLSKTIPEKGVIVVFGGSLKTVDVNASFY